MECPKCKAKVGMMKHELMISTGAVSCVKCFICGFWVQTAADTGLLLPTPAFPRQRRRFTGAATVASVA